MDVSTLCVKVINIFLYVFKIISRKPVSRTAEAQATTLIEIKNWKMTSAQTFISTGIIETSRPYCVFIELAEQENPWETF